jgi:L-lactate utilization protein LutC
VKLFVKGNEKLTFALAMGIFSTLVLSLALSPLMVKAQSQNETQQQLTNLAEKVKELASNAGLNLTLPEGANITESLQSLANSGALKNVSQQLSQQLSELNLNSSVIENLKQKAGSDFGTLVQQLQNLTSSRTS